MEVKVQLMKVDTPSATGRIYSKESIQEAIDNFNKREIKGGSLGLQDVNDLSHPTNLKDLSHVFENIRIEDDKVLADMKILDTPQGDNVKALLESDVKLALAPRLSIDEQPKLDENGNQVLDENGNPVMETKVVDLISFDIIQDNQKTFEGNTITMGDSK